MKHLDVFHPECYYLIYNRANNDENIFTQNRNYHYFLQKFDYYLSPVVDVLSYCLMDKRFLFLVRVKSANVPFFIENDSMELSFHNLLSKQFRDFFIAYSKAFNKQEDRFGSLFQRPFKRVEIKSQKKLKETILYIHSMPQKYSLFEDNHSYKWCSYHEIINEGETKLLRKEVLNYFGGRKQFIEYHQSEV